MADSSTEDSYSHGLGFVKGTVSRFSESSLKVPHMGFNQVEIKRNSKLFKGLNNMSDFYFVHSFYFKTVNKDHTLATTNYPEKITAAINTVITSYEKKRPLLIIPCLKISPKKLGIVFDLFLLVQIWLRNARESAARLRERSAATKRRRTLSLSGEVHEARFFLREAE